MKYSNDRSDFVAIDELIPDVVYDIRYFSNYNFIGEKIDGYEEPVALLCHQAAEALAQAAAEFAKQGYLLKIYDAYRPQMAVDHFMRWAKDTDDIRMKAYFYPDLPKADLIPFGYIAEHSAHTRGSAVDLTLIAIQDDKEADMGSAFDLFSELSHPDSDKVTLKQHRNRMYLQETMIRHGFLPVKEEWWHFTLKDEPYPDTYFTFAVKK